VKSLGKAALTGFAQESEIGLAQRSEIGLAQESEFYTSALAKVNRWSAAFIPPAGYVFSLRPDDGSPSKTRNRVTVLSIAPNPPGMRRTPEGSPIDSIQPTAMRRVQE
jgi:hypothetical protein